MNTKKLRNYKRNSTACRQGFGVSAKRRRELKNIERKNLRLALKYIPFRTGFVSEDFVLKLTHEI